MNRSYWLLTLLLTAGCANDDTTDRNCTNDGVGCNNGFTCVGSNTGEYRCAPAVGADAGRPEPEANCQDGIQNGNETGIDCAGDCRPCPDGWGCEEGINCSSGVCVEGACAAPRCGDGFANGEEQCDDGNELDTDACLPTCVPAACGDGVVHNGVESCDDGNTVTEECEYGVEACMVCGETCVELAGAVRFCGDGEIDVEEACDDGNDQETDECTNFCLPAICGDGLVNAGVEECDDGNRVNTDLCTNFCEAAACGDGFVGPGEVCDDGNENEDDECTSACMQPLCGDGILHEREECDDGNAIDDDGCSNVCHAQHPPCMGIACADANCADGHPVIIDTLNYNDMTFYPLDFADCDHEGACCAPTNTQQQMNAFCRLAGHCRAVEWNVRTLASDNCYCWGKCSEFRWASDCCRGGLNRNFVTEVTCR
jgi:cysteine-rich repeat protein